MIATIIANRRLLAAAGLFLAGLAVGWQVQAWRYGAKEAEAVQARFEAWAAATATANTISAALEEKLTVERENNRKLAKRLSHELRKDAYRHPIPTDGVRILNDALYGPVGSGEHRVPTGEDRPAE